MAIKREGDPRTSQMLDVVGASSTWETLPGVFWVVCPEHGIGQAVRVVRGPGNYHKSCVKEQVKSGLGEVCILQETVETVACHSL